MSIGAQQLVKEAHAKPRHGRISLIVSILLGLDDLIINHNEHIDVAQADPMRPFFVIRATP
jgi:hypothetical protein